MKKRSNKARDILADLYSRKNAMNGKYKACNLGIDNELIRENDVVFLETLRIKADLADEKIAQAESQGKDTNDLNVLNSLGEDINVSYTPVHRRKSILTAIFASFYLMVFYGIATGIWGLVFKKGFLGFFYGGLVLGFMISLLSAAPVIAVQLTKQRMNDMITAASSIWGSLAVIVGITGLVTWVIRTIFFS